MVKKYGIRRERSKSHASPLVPVHWPSICKAWDTIYIAYYIYLGHNHVPYMKYLPKKLRRKRKKKERRNETLLYFALNQKLKKVGGFL